MSSLDMKGSVNMWRERKREDDSKQRNRVMKGYLFGQVVAHMVSYESEELLTARTPMFAGKVKYDNVSLNLVQSSQSMH